jgi:ESS family glutamate:Na+ symporter
MISGIIIGMIMVNWALKKGYVKEIRTFNERSYMERIGVYGNNERPSAGLQTVFCDSIDSLAFHVALIGIAILIGFGILKGLQSFEVFIAPNEKLRLFKGFPLFPLCMLGGVLLQLFAKLINVDLLVDKDQMNRISGAALDYLSLSAVATIELSVVAANWIPLVIMSIAGVTWRVCSVMYFSPRLFKEAWFERGIAEFGQATGVTATGLLLLRTVDPDNKTIAAASFAGKQLLHEPGMNVWVALAFALVFTVGWMPVFFVSLAMLSFWIVVSIVLMRRMKKGKNRG